MPQKFVTNDEMVTGLKAFFVAIFGTGTFERYVTKLRGYF
jgi:hypothetical protein